MKVNRITPLLLVDAIEPELAMWKERLGFAVVVEVPHDGRLGFAIVAQGEHQIMMQTKASLADDLPALGGRKMTGLLYVDVASLDDAIEATRGAKLLAGPRTTFYGAKEICVEDPAGQVVIFGEHAARAAGGTS